IGTNLGELDLVSVDCKFNGNYFDLSAGEIRKIAVKKESLSEHLRLDSFKVQLTLRGVYDISS
ncbi:glycoside hydrolase family 2 protein, partial [Bacillus sp. AFS040349]|uniref:glycoside hydrolase family 2 protein n=1 Tax=Bacillus sp. AFS040349 TaxID=2033502 RepID=UPI000C02BE35